MRLVVLEHGTYLLACFTLFMVLVLSYVRNFKDGGFTGMGLQKCNRLIQDVFKILPVASVAIGSVIGYQCAVIVVYPDIKIARSASQLAAYCFALCLRKRPYYEPGTITAMTQC